jgi:hypothetical protein
MIQPQFSHSVFFFATDIQQPHNCFQINVIFFLSTSGATFLHSNFRLGRKFQASTQKIFDTKFRPNFLKFPDSFSLSYPNIRTYRLLCSDTDIKRTARTRILLVWEEMSVNIRQAACSLFIYICQSPQNGALLRNGRKYVDAVHGDPLGQKDYPLAQEFSFKF